MLWSLEKIKEGGEQLKGKKAQEVYDELRLLSGKQLLALDDAIKIQKQLVKIRPQKRGGQENHRIKSLLTVLKCLFSGGSVPYQKEVQRIAKYYVALDSQFYWIKPLACKYETKNDYGRPVDVLRTRFKIKKMSSDEIDEERRSFIGHKSTAVIIHSDFKHLNKRRTNL